MARFNIRIAGQVAAVDSLFESTRDYCGRYLTEAEPDFSVAVCEADLAFEQAELDAEARREGLRLRVFTPPFLERAAIQRKVARHLLTRDTILIHGSAVAGDDMGYLFTAKCGTGKSTHTRLWREVFGSRAVMINDDKPFVRITAAGIQVCGAPWSGKHGLDTNAAVPLKGICILERGAENRIERIPAAEALPMLLHQSGAPETQEASAQLQTLVRTLSEQTPQWRMYCNRNPEAARLAHEAMSSACLEGAYNGRKTAWR